MFIDTHTHLYSDQFDDDREQMILRALNAGVKKLLLPNIDCRSIPGMYELEAQFPENCHAMMGLHPCSVDATYESVLAQIRVELEQRKFIAIGETGIDLYWDKSFLEEQKISFGIQLEWAKEFGIPVVIHARDSFPEIFEVLDKHNDSTLRGVFHCFTGGLGEIEKIRSYGDFYFGIGGVLTFKKSGLDETVKHLHMDEIILETDSPYLAPSPHRGKRNESSYLPLIAEKLSDVFQIPVKEIADETSRNAEKCFNLTK